MDNIYNIGLAITFLITCWPLTLGASAGIAIILAIPVSIVRTTLDYRKFKREEHK